MTQTGKKDREAAKVRMKYGAYLKREREARQFTQKFVADYLGFRTPQLISNWERGIAVPPLKEVRKLAYLYRVNRDELISIFTEYHSAVCSDTIEHVKKIFEASNAHRSQDNHLLH